MTKSEWFRRNTWTKQDQEEFNARLKRTRGDSNKAQYLRIQALHLAEAGQDGGAIELLDRLLLEYPNGLEIAQAHAQKADLLAKSGQTVEAVNEYRNALQAERDFPNVKTSAWLDFGWLVVTNRVLHLYDEVDRVLKEFREEGGLQLPIVEYRYAAIQALLADARVDGERARQFAKQALEQAAKSHSGLRYHPTLALVGPEWNTLNVQLRSLASG